MRMRTIFGGLTMKRNKLIVKQLDKTLAAFRPLLSAGIPSRGWIRAIRDAVGMNGRQFADRMGVHRTRSGQIESDEVGGSVTIKTMRRAAEALDCAFVYGFVPRESLAQTLRDRAGVVASSRHARVSQTMRLEGQALDERQEEESLSDAISELLDNPPSSLWDAT